MLYPVTGESKKISIEVFRLAVECKKTFLEGFFGFSVIATSSVGGNVNPPKNYPPYFRKLVLQIYLYLKISQATSNVLKHGSSDSMN